MTMRYINRHYLSISLSTQSQANLPSNIKYHYQSLWGVKIKNIHNFHETWMTVPLWYKKYKI